MLDMNHDPFLGHDIEGARCKARKKRNKTKKKRIDSAIGSNSLDWWGGLKIVDSNLVIGFVGATSQFRKNLIVDVVVIERVEALAIMCDARVEGRVEPKKMIGSRENVT